ncbi:hypothetical protein OAH87_00660 [Marinomonas sp.]|nr:hypothetical protein [Marinomonas sp.]MDB4836965.1 hypothetical protein [Marinomonas sp.]
MSSSQEAQAIAETYLKEMLEADDTADFALYTKRYEEKYLQGFTSEIFAKDIQQMQARNGMNQGYEFLAQLRSSFIEDSALQDIEVLRFVWKGQYEKRDAVIEVAIYEKNGTWYLIQSSVH